MSKLSLFLLSLLVLVPAFAAENAPKKTLTAEELEEITSSKHKTHYEAIDAMLADTLIDPSSPMQYEVSGLIPCKTLGKFATEVAGDQQCACFYVNAKNSHGGYIGKKLGIMSIFPMGKGFMAMDISEHTVSHANELKCVGAHFQKRDGALIRAAAGIP